MNKTKFKIFRDRVLVIVTYTLMIIPVTVKDVLNSLIYSLRGTFRSFKEAWHDVIEDYEG